jgi:hypothetical protein
LTGNKQHLKERSISIFDLLLLLQAAPNDNVSVVKREEEETGGE